jgi:hypothetical protein
MSVNLLKSKPFSDIKNLKLSYIDDTLTYTKTSFATREHFDFSFYDCLDNFNDMSVNNYSYFFLGKKQLFSDWVEANLKVSSASGFSSAMRFTLDGEGAYLFFDADSIESTPDIKSTWDCTFSLKTETDLAVSGITASNIADYHNYVFIVEYIEGTNQCYIKFINSAQTFYFYNRKIDEHNSDIDNGIVDDLWFTTQTALRDKFGKFYFIKKDNKMMIFTSELDHVLIRSEDGIEAWANFSNNLTDNGDGTYTIKRAKDYTTYPISDDYLGLRGTIVDYGRVRSIVPDASSATRMILVPNKEMLPVVNYNGFSYDATCTITDRDVDFGDFLNPAWLSYQDRTFLDVNVDKSAYDLETQCLFHLQYNKFDDTYTSELNIIPLKNNVSSTNLIMRGDYMNSGTKYTPDVNFREYTTIDTGSNQEFGNSNITLTYTFYSLEYYIDAGEDFAFKIKEDDDSKEGALKYALYPFVQMNINDSKFIKNGALGSTVPFLADKVKKVQKNSKFTNNGRYLYTWLYQEYSGSDNNKYGVWMDRYYYPDSLTKGDTLKCSVNFDASFNDIIDKDYVQANDPTFIPFIEGQPYFDKLSDFVFESNTEYVYSRVGESEVQTILDDCKDYQQEVIESYASTKDTEEIIKFDNTPYKNSGELDINFDIYLDNSLYYGVDLMSNSCTTGLTIRNEKTTTPFLYAYDNVYNADSGALEHTYIRLLNYSYTLIKEVDIESLYGLNEEIRELVLNLPFEDFGVLTTKSLYILSFDLSIKQRFDLKELLTIEGDQWVLTDDVSYTIQKVWANKHKYYFLCRVDSCMIDHELYTYKPVFCLDLDKGSTLQELTRYTAYSRLAYKVNDTNKTKLYPVYFFQPDAECESYGNLIDTGTLTKYDEKIYEVIMDEDYYLPHGLKAGDKVVLVNDLIQEYDPTYFYRVPFIETEDYYGMHNSLCYNSIYVDKDDIVYAFPHYMIQSSTESDEIYAVREVYVDELYNIETIDLDDYRDDVIDSGNSNICFRCYSKVYGLAIDNNGRIAVLKKETNKLDDDAELGVLVFDKTKKLKKTFTLGSDYDHLFGLDTLRVYVQDCHADYFTVFGRKTDEETGIESCDAILIDEDYVKHVTELDYLICPDQVQCINYSLVQTQHYSDSLDFILNLPKSSLIVDQYIYSIGLTDLTAGWYNIRIKVNLNTGVYEVYMNDTLATVKQSVFIDKFVYNTKNVFNYPFIIGSAVYRNGVSLSDFLELEDSPFKVKNLRFKNFYMYSKVLEQYERQALLLSISGIEPLTISLPGGQQNNLEEIVRFFKYAPPSNMSNKLRINIKNAEIDSVEDRQKLALEILNKINEELACPLTIKEINFI